MQFDSVKNKWAYGIFEEWKRQRLVKVPFVEVKAFYFKPNSKRLAYDKQAVGINKLNGIHPMQIWRTTPSSPGTSCMKARLVGPRCFALTMLSQRSLASLVI